MSALPPVRPGVSARALIQVLLVLGAVGASFLWLDMPLATLFSAAAASEVAGFVLRFLPPDLEPAFLVALGYAALETLAISLVGTLLAAALAVVLALPAAGRQGRSAQQLCRFVLNLLRSVPELVWATLMVLAAGLGPFAGTLALALHTAGVLGRLFAEALENAPQAPALALAESGASGLATFLYGTLPLLAPQWLAYALYRWEINIRMAAVLGFVGAGGLGAQLHYSLSLFHEARAGTVILAMLAMAVTVDAISAGLRRASA